MTTKYYWEKQGGDRMCAVHTLNSLVQGPIFTEVTLASAAHELDAQEKKLLGLAPDAPYESQNVDNDGNFSLPAMERALQNFGTGVSMVNMDRADIRSAVMKDCSKEQAYICNSHARSHWYCIRKVKGRWYDFDSLKPAPTFIGEMYLTAFLETTMQSGFTVFVCRPKGEGGHTALNGKFVMDQLRLPDAEESCRANGRQKQLQGHQHLLEDKDMERMHEEAKKREQGELAGDFGSAYNSKKKDEATDWSKLGSGNTLSGGPGPATPMDMDMDPDLAAAIKASMADMAATIEVPEPAPEPTEGGLTIMIRFKSDEPLKRVFEKTAPLKSVFGFVEYANLKQEKFKSIQPALVTYASQSSYSLLKSGFPKKEKFVKKPDGEIYLNDEKVGDTTLAERDFGGREALVLQLD